MIPFYFGNRNRQLFGVHHPANSRVSLSHGVLLCPPVGQEYMRTHMALRQLAVQLAASGFDVLRFDYYGTGDSTGSSEEGDWEQWKEDVRDACQELKDISGAQSISLVGLRIGAALAAQAAAEGLKVKNIVLWDPIVNGQQYIADMESMTRQILNVHSDSGYDGCKILMGYPYSRQAIESLKEVDLLNLSFRRKPNFMLLVSEDKEEYIALVDKLKTGAREIILTNIAEQVGAGKVVDSSFGRGSPKQAKSLLYQWNNPEDFSQTLLAHQELSTITSYFKARYDRKSI